MARNVRANKLESRSQRLRLPIAKKPIWLKLDRGLHVGYRRNEGVGTWSMRVADGRGSNWVKRLGEADDVRDDRGMSFWAAQARARELRYGGADTGDKLQTVNEAIESYRADLETRHGDQSNADRLGRHIPPTLGTKLVAQLNARELRAWRDGLLRVGLKPPSVRRTSSCLRAALTLAAKHDPRITNMNAWRHGLENLPDSHVARNVIVADAAIRRIVHAAYEVDERFGLFCELCATLGCRPVQAARLSVEDVKTDKLLLPSSLKGRRKQLRRSPVPIPPTLALKLKAAGKGREATAPLLLKNDGTQWCNSDHIKWWRETLLHAALTAGEVTGAKPDEVTFYCLRHSSIVRQLLRNVPIRIVAAHHDNSVIQIEKSYSRFISNVSDSLVRGALLDLNEPRDNVVTLDARH
jgi:integrase